MFPIKKPSRLILDKLSVPCRDQALQHTLAFGIGIHHAGLAEGDRNVVEALFEQGKIQVLIYVEKSTMFVHGGLCFVFFRAVVVDGSSQSRFCRRGWGGMR